jgi:hypothetical protein
MFEIVMRAFRAVRGIAQRFQRFFNEYEKMLTVMLLALTLAGSIIIANWSRTDAMRIAKMSRQDSYTQMQASILNDFRKRFESMRHERLISSEFALKHLHDKIIPLNDIPPEVWMVMDFFDELSMYSKRNYVDKEMTFVGFYFWMSPYYQFYGEEVHALQEQNPLVMYNEIPVQLKLLKQAGTKLGRTDADFAKAESDEQIAEFFRSECMEALALSAPSIASCQPGSSKPSPARPPSPNRSPSASKPAEPASPATSRSWRTNSAP